MNYKELIASQRCYFNSFSTISIDFRIEQLKKMKAQISAHETELIAALKEDLNKHEFESYGSEIGLSIVEIDHVIENLRKWCQPQKVASPRFAFPSTSYTKYDPLGLTLIISPWNYPIQLTIIPLVGAIAAGCTSVVKPSELAPASANVLKKIIQKTFKPEYIAICEGGIDVSTALLQEKYDLIFYTGSTQIGKIVYQKAAETLTPVVLELGGKSPCVVDNTCDIEVTAKRIAWGKLINVGQTCIAPDYILIDEKVKDIFVEKIIKELKACYTDTPLTNEQYGKIISKKHFDRLLALLKDEKIIHGGQCDSTSNKISPTLVDITDVESAIMQEEIFGPLLPILTYKNIDEAIMFINKRPKPLALYVFSKNSQTIKKMEQFTSAGSMCINDCLFQITNVNYGFGGVGDSGMGSYHGKQSIACFSHNKTITNRGTWLDLDMRYAPYGRYSLEFLKKAMRWSF